MNPMMLIRLLRGYVSFEITGGFIERFVNLCAHEKINLWDVSVNSNKLKGCTVVKNYKRMKKVLRKSGCSVKLKEKYGLPFYIKKHKHRIGLFIGIIFYILFSVIMNRFVWVVEVKGTDTVGNEEIISVTEELGLYRGVFSSQLNTVEISRQAVNRFNGRLMWMAINIKGSKAVIEVRDYIDEHKGSEYSDPCNLVADFDGTILSVEVYHGDSEISAGNAVKKGDLLISGVIENRDMSCVYYEARGRITAYHEERDIYEFPAKNKFSKIADSENLYVANFLHLRIPLNFEKADSHENKLIYDKSLSSMGLKLPLGITKTVLYNNIPTEAANKHRLLIAVDEYTSNFYNGHKNTNILKLDNKISFKDGVFIITNGVKCIDFMGIQSPINVNFYEK